MLAACFAVLVLASSAHSRPSCYKPISRVAERAEWSIPSRPHAVLDIPANWDWRNVGGKSLVSNVLTQQNPHVCGSCWAEAATGAFSDRFKIATNGTLQVNFAVQVLLNYNETMSGGTCFGGDDYIAAKFFTTYGISDDTCAPFAGVDFAWGFDCCDGDNASTSYVRNHMCHSCDWDGTCGWVEDYRLYRASEAGKVKGEHNMMAEIYARGPIACSVDSGPDAFDQYTGGIITASMLPASNDTDHVIVVAGFGVDAKTGLKFWVGRNSYGTRWGEGSSGGWFRLERGKDLLLMESNDCSFAVPHPQDVARIMKEYSPEPPKPILII